MPIVWSEPPRISMNNGGIFNLVIRNPGVVALAMGDSRRSGSNRTSAPMADVELTICSLCGMLKMAAKKGNPVRNPLL